MGSRRQDGGREMTKFQFLRSLFLLSCVQARLVRRETSSLIEAAQQGNLDRVRRLVNDAHAPDVNELGPNDRTPLIFAASFGDPAIVQELVRAGARYTGPPIEDTWRSCTSWSAAGWTSTSQPRWTGTQRSNILRGTSPRCMGIVGWQISYDPSPFSPKSGISNV